MGKDEPKPMSRFWSCFFAGTIFALFWTVPMKTSIKWAIMYVCLGTVAFGLRILTGAVAESGNVGVTLGFVALSFAPLAWMIKVMYGWVTAYNLEHFGYKNRAEWEEARRDAPE